MDTAKNLKPFYVYALIDGRDGSIFYIGEGSNDRIFQHEKEVRRRAEENLKQQKIEEIISCGSRVNKIVIGRYDSKKQAIAVESTLIHWVYGIENLTNIQSGHGVTNIRPKGNYNQLQSIDEPELNYCVRQEENRERNNIPGFLLELKQLIETECDIKFDGIDTHNDRHTYLYKIIKGVKLTVVAHHSARRAAAVTIESLNGKAANRAKVQEICNNTKLEWKNDGRYGRIMPAGTYNDPLVILVKFKETLSEIESFCH